MRVLICGGRSYNDWEKLCDTLDGLNAVHRFSLVIHGGAQGADTLAEQWAFQRHIDVKKFPALWTKHGKAAGPIRNKQMIDEGLPELVIAFKGRRGTENMKEQAHAAGIRVIDLSQ